MLKFFKRIIRKFMVNKNRMESDFIPYLYLDNPFIDVLASKLESLGVIEKKNHKQYVFQVKLMVYTSFNKYLHLLFLDISDDKLINTVKQLEFAKNSKEVISALEFGLEEKSSNIIDNFLKYFKKDK